MGSTARPNHLLNWGFLYFMGCQSYTHSHKRKHATLSATSRLVGPSVTIVLFSLRLLPLPSERISGWSFFFHRCMLAEMLGTFMIVLIGEASVAQAVLTGKTFNVTIDGTSGNKVGVYEEKEKAFNSFLSIVLGHFVSLNPCSLFFFFSFFCMQVYLSLCESLSFCSSKSYYNHSTSGRPSINFKIISSLA